MAVVVPAVERFTALKQQRDALSNRVAILHGKLDSSREHYNSIMRELVSYNIGSLDELRAKIAELTQQINAGLDEGEALLQKMQQELSAVVMEVVK